MALDNLPESSAANFESNVRSILGSWKTSIENKVPITHSHSGASLYLTIAADMAALGTGSTTAELGVTQDTLSLYTWNQSGATWNLVSNAAFNLIQFQMFA